MDLLKGFCILSVVFIHGQSLLPLDPSHSRLTASLADAMAKAFKLGVPIFIFFWAYFLEKSVLKRGRRVLRDRFHKLLVPFVAWSLVYFLLLADFGRLSYTKMLTMHWAGHGWAGQYYYIILFQLLFLFPFIRKAGHWLTDSLPLLYAGSLLFYILITHSGWFGIGIVGKLGERPFIYWLPYVLLGIRYAHRDVFGASIPLLLGLVSIVLVPLEIYAFRHSTHLLPSLYLASLLLIGSVMNAKVPYDALPSWLGASLLLIARSTLGIFCLNPLIILLLAPVFQALGVQARFPGSGLLVPLLGTGLITGLCLLLIALLKRLGVGFLVAN